jgi:hypothetical protein
MTEQEWTDVQAVVFSDIDGIVHAQRTLHDVKEQLAARAQHRSEEDRIFRDAFGLEPGEAREVSVDGVDIEVTLLHRKGASHSDIMGADLLYEIAGQKFILIQYKRASNSGRVVHDDAQLTDLIAACPNPCPPWSEGLVATCGAWYSVSEDSYMPACMAKQIFGAKKSKTAKSFGRGLPQDVFDTLFARCWSGARIAPARIAVVAWRLFELNRAMFVVTQRGSFGRW